MATAAGAERLSPLQSLYAEFIDTFGNVLFAVSLLVVWGVMTLIGVVVDQGKAPAAYFNEYPAELARAILRLGLDHIYHSYEYVGLIGLIIVSLAVCTFKRVIPARLPPLRPVLVDKIPLHAFIEARGTEEQVRARLERFFAKAGWHVRRKLFNGVEWTFADRHNWARRGVLVAHLGFVIIAAGTTLYWWKGYQGEIAILSGQTARIPQNGDLLTVHSFNYTIKPTQTRGGVIYQPVDYVSDLTATSPAGKTERDLLRVNHPLQFDGIAYYQASYGYGVTFRMTQAGKPVAGVPATPLLEGDSFPLGPTGRAIQYTQFVGTIDPKSPSGIGADPRPFNPGVVVTVFDGAQPIGSEIVPLGHAVDLGGGYRLEPASYRLYSGIQYRHDPGIPLVGLGALVLVAGVCISFYLLPARLFVRLEGEGERWTVGLAAQTPKGYTMYEEQFAGLVAALQRSEEATAT
ncbi:MAG TPA: cytochrome c biogenesis protein ResB [Candidatus Dormibacteraeota bacterium]|nr:cytochrome c biogenesis protein ResB [Candidatus Dormibacteraeota bacterium]